jgi:hypothetical protein
LNPDFKAPDLSLTSFSGWLDFVVETKKKEIKFRTIRPRPGIVGTTTNNCVHQILRHVSSSEFCKKKSDKKIRNTPVDNLLSSQ